MNTDSWEMPDWLREELRGTRWIPQEEFRQTQRRQASRVHHYDLRTEDFITGLNNLIRSTDQSLDSWAGDVCVALPHETWPYNGARPLMPLLQINLTTLPYCPESLSDLALLAFFIDPGNLPTGPDTPNGEKWLLRAYPRLDDLVPLARPDDLPFWNVQKTPLRWEVVEDFPPLDHGKGNLLPIFEGCESWYDYADLYREAFDTHSFTKVGGWPLPVQGAVTWGAHRPPDLEYAFQIDSDLDWTWGDVGTAYLGRGQNANRALWMFDWDCL